MVIGNIGSGKSTILNKLVAAYKVSKGLPIPKLKSEMLFKQVKSVKTATLGMIPVEIDKIRFIDT
jgi:ABC-type phosphate/phosphonate transport system ATPase subunit